jgi:hypothetical protein
MVLYPRTRKIAFCVVALSYGKRHKYYANATKSIAKTLKHNTTAPGSTGTRESNIINLEQRQNYQPGDDNSVVRSVAQKYTQRNSSNGPKKSFSQPV